MNEATHRRLPKWAIVLLCVTTAVALLTLAWSILVAVVCNDGSVVFCGG